MNDDGGDIIRPSHDGPGRWLRVFVVLGRTYQRGEQPEGKYARKRFVYLHRKQLRHFGEKR